MASPGAERPTLASYLEAEPTGMRAFRKSLARMTGMRGAFSGKKPSSAQNNLEMAEAISTGSDEEAMVLLSIYMEHHPEEAKTVTAPPSNQPMAWLAATNSQWKCTQRLLEAGAVIGDRWDEAVAHSMRQGGDDRALPLLLRYLADHGAPEDGAGADAQGDTLLHVAAATGCQECCKELLGAQWDPQRQNGAGQTPDALASACGGDDSPVTRTLQEARRAAELGLSLGRVGARRKWASEYKASVDKKDTEEAQRALAEKKGVVQERREWASTYKAKVDKKDTEEAQRALAERKGNVQAKHDWVKNYKADVKRSEMEEMQRHLGGNSNIVAERKQWVDTYKSSPNPSVRSAGTMNSSDARTTIGNSTSALREKWSQHEASGAPASPKRGDNALSPDDAQRVIGNNTSALRERWQNAGSPTNSQASSVRSPPQPKRLDLDPHAESGEASGVPPVPELTTPVADAEAELQGSEAGEEEYNDIELEVSGKPLGFQLGEDNDLVTVFDIRAEGNAAKAGVEKDDVILGVNGTKLVGMGGAEGLRTAQEMLVKDESYPVTLSIRRFVFDEEDGVEDEVKEA